MPFIETRNGTRLFVKDWGTGKPVLLSHGWPMHADMWEYQMPALVAAGFRCLAMDRRGFGRSDHPGHGYDFETFADDLAAVLTALDLHEVTLVGYSMGAGEITRYLARHGATRVARAVLIGGALSPMDEAMAGMMSQMIAADRPQFMTDGVPSLFAATAGESVSAAQMQWVVGLALQASPLATLACLRAFGQNDFRTELGAFTMPTLVIHGDADGSQPVTVAREVAAAIPGTQYLEYAGAPHGLFLTERTRLAGDLVRFARGG
ncbi:MAG: alpha/beta hydrolase [Candidatus Binatia bacterium]